MHPAVDRQVAVGNTIYPCGWICRRHVSKHTVILILSHLRSRYQHSSEKLLVLIYPVLLYMPVKFLPGIVQWAVRGKEWVAGWTSTTISFILLMGLFSMVCLGCTMLHCRSWTDCKWSWARSATFTIFVKTDHSHRKLFRKPCTSAAPLLSYVSGHPYWSTENVYQRSVNHLSYDNPLAHPQAPR